MKSPNGAFEVVQHHYDEIRMGSPLFGQLEIRGSSFGLVAGEFAQPVAFSTDSRFLAAAEFVSTVPDPQGRVVVFDFERTIRLIVFSFPGFARQFTWEPDGALAATTWSLRGGEDTRRVWSPPPPKPPAWWRRFFRGGRHRLTTRSSEQRLASGSVSCLRPSWPASVAELEFVRQLSPSAGRPFNPALRWSPWNPRALHAV